MALPTLLIIADDLTGATDCASYAPRAGLPAVVALDALAAPGPGLTVLALDTRALPPQEAAARVRAAVLALRDVHDVRWFKKIDSMMRGNVGAETEAMLDATRRRTALVCPALPVMNRAVVGGRLVGAPGGAVHIPARLAEQSALPSARVAHTRVARGGMVLVEALRDAAQAARLLVVDALTDADLDRLARAAGNFPDALLCGSGGLAAAWLRLYGSNVARPAPVALPGDQRVLAIIGSASDMAHRQLAACAQAGMVVTEYRSGAPAWPAGEWGLAIHLPMLSEGGVLEEAHAVALARVAVDLIRSEGIGRLVTAGGATSAAVLRGLAISHLDVLYEGLPGMPVVRCRDPQGKPYAIALKPGSHGDERSLLHLLRALRARPAE